MCDSCKIINKEVDAYVVHETKRIIVFLDYMQNGGECCEYGHYHRAFL